MKQILVAAALLIGSQAFAGVADVAPSPDSTLSRVEKVITVQPNQAGKPGIRLVQVDNGGSTDISSVLAPSSLLLTFHKDGEEFDIDGTYAISDGMSDLKLESVDLPRNKIVVSYLVKSENNMNGLRYYSTLYIGEALKEIALGTSQNLTTTIGVQTYVP